ncbi:hypothetical protein V1512DRAFT_244735 [Lipomyces arxii]|uniref:uncharacterized protein n=1 Tax=Lipomyces arxii TaxID=56418 RepID=UPI0034CF21F0
MSLWAKYNAIPFSGRMWIGISTTSFAYIGMVGTDYLYNAKVAEVNSFPASPPSDSEKAI